MKKINTQKIGWFALAMLITGGIDSIRNLPTTALFGSTLIFFFIFSAVVFLIPTALVSAELSANIPSKGGIFYWTQAAFGDKTGFMAIWLQWINTMVWYPTILSFIAGTVAYLFNPHLANNKYYLIAVILGTFWIQTLINLFGIKISAKFASLCAIFGMIIPMAMIIFLGLLWILLGHPLNIQITAHSLLPDLHHSQNWIALTAIITSFVGMELATVHVNHVENAQKAFPKALFLSVSIILVTMIFGSLAIAVVLPKSQISLIDGTLEAFSLFFTTYHLSFMMPIVAVMILIGSIGGMTNWIISPAKGLLQAANIGYLPTFFTHVNKEDVPVRLLIAQAVLVSIFCLAFLIMPSVNGSYWLLTDLSTQLYMFMYILMFFSAIALKYKIESREISFKIPGGKFGMNTTCLLGLFGCLCAITVGFIPPSDINVGGAMHYEILFCAGLVGMLIPAFVIIVLKNIRKNRVILPG